MSDLERPMAAPLAAVAVESSSSSEQEFATTETHRGFRLLVGLVAAGLAIVAAGVTVARIGHTTGELRRGDQWVRLSQSRTVHLDVTIRDFIASKSSTHSTFSHPDFEPTYPHARTVQKGLVQNELGTDGKPVWKGCGGVAECSLPSEATFNEWYRTGLRNREVKDVKLEVRESSTNPGEFKLDRPNFFPLTGDMGFGDRHSYVPYNYYFTMEAKTTFVYHGDEWFKFRGDDDLWIFFNNKLAIDLGGVHAQASDTYNLFEPANEAYLGLEKGQTVYINIFFAERSFSSSNFMINTNIKLDQDACFEYDRVYLTEHPAANNLPTGAISWHGEYRTKQAMDGEDVMFSFKCVEGQHCNANQKGSLGGFPLMQVEAWQAMPLTFEMDRDLPAYYITFYNMVHGMSVEATGVTGYTRMGDSAISYSKDGSKDVFTSDAPLLSATPIFPNELTEEQKQKSLMLTFASQEGVTITLRNNRPDSMPASFMFTATPMFHCIPCFPACPDNEPLAETRTTTTTTIQGGDENLGKGGIMVIASQGSYDCCFIDLFGVKINCDLEKKWWKPWCPNSPGFQWPWQR